MDPIVLKPTNILVRFQPIRLGSPSGGEDAWLGWVDDHLVALFVRVQGTGVPRRRHGWFLEAGYGPCRREGLHFPSLNAAEGWIREQIRSGWQELRLQTA